jgi:hypothetical protein
MKKELIERMAKWGQEAKDEDNKYFYAPPSFEGLIDGSKYIVTGRKGAGKTGALRFVEKVCLSKNIFYSTINVGDFDFEQLANYAVNSGQSVPFWQHMIYSVALSHIARNVKKEPSMAKWLPSADTASQAYYYMQLENRSITTGTVNIVDDRAAPWSIRAYALRAGLEALAEELTSPIEIVIGFDELDGQFMSDRPQEMTSRYIKLIGALINAVRAVSSHGNLGRMITIRPIVLIRSDIKNLIHDNDKTKWNDRTIELSWTPQQIDELLKFRLSIDAEQPLFEFGIFGGSLFLYPRMGDEYDYRYSKPNLYWIEYRTTWAPRDYIVMLKQMAVQRLERTKMTDWKIDPATMKAAERDYVKYMRQQLVDEGKPHINDIEEKLNQMERMATRESRKRNYKIGDFVEAFGVNEEETSIVLKKFYQLNAIGNFKTGDGESQGELEALVVDQPPGAHPKSAPWNTSWNPRLNYQHSYRYKDSYFGELDPRGIIRIHPSIHQAFLL